ncbi:hypothetical protein ACFO5R_09545 [Halosolutus amylolyticus]|uniref:DUF7350 domain-containing protein n=1 Tax=Halosolutus amylolyticus TaxID=2932267 RepID=A0ABD5PNZ5_9EURY|nr:hypothetical protein [Halosolutus amylolyticus]
MNRRRVLSTGAAIGVSTCLAGCFGGDEEESDAENDPGGERGEDADGGFATMARVEDPPDAVYLPSHRDGMIGLETVRAGDVAIAPMLSIPHSFWIWPGPERVDPPPNDAVHLMVSVRDPETGTVLPVDASAAIEVSKDGAVVSDKRPWTMLSQGMGYHLGDNYRIEGNGTYTATVSLGPIADVRLTGAFEGRFDERATATIEFELDDERRQELVDRSAYFDEDRWGDREAVSPMGDGHDGHAMPYSSLPPADDLPGTLLGEPTHDDGVYVTTLLPAGSRFVDGDERYLVVSPRTPYNDCVLPQQSLSMRLERDGETIEEADLTATLDDELGFHYGAPVAEPRAGDELVVSVDTPPQVARHQGYETAFRSTGDLSIELEEGVS